MNTCFFSDTETTWHAEGLKMDLVEPMKKWRVTYQGEMIHQTTGKVHKVDLNVRQFNCDVF